MPASAPRGGAGVAEPASPSLNAAAPVFVPKQLRASAPAFVPRANASPFHPSVGSAFASRQHPLARSSLAPPSQMPNFSMPPMQPMPNLHLNPMQFGQSTISQFSTGVTPLHFSPGPVPTHSHVRTTMSPAQPVNMPKPHTAVSAAAPAPTSDPAPAPAPSAPTPAPTPTDVNAVETSADTTSLDSTVSLDPAPSTASVAEEIASCEVVSVSEDVQNCEAVSPAAPIVTGTESEQPETVPSEEQETTSPVPVCEVEKPAPEQPVLSDDNAAVLSESDNSCEAAQEFSGGLQETPATGTHVEQTAPDVLLAESLEPIPEGAIVNVPAPESSVDEVAGEPMSAVEDATSGGEDKVHKAPEVQEVVIPADRRYTVDFIQSLRGTWTEMPDEVTASLTCFGKGPTRQLPRDERRRGYDRARGNRGYGGSGSSGMDRSSSFSSGSFRDRGRHPAARNAAESERDANFSRASFGISAGQTEYQGDRRSGRRDRNRHRHGRDRSPSPYTGPVAPLKVTENHYRVHKDIEGEAKLMRQMQSILNKLTPEKFDVLVDKLVTLILEHVEYLDSAVQLVFNKAVMEFNFATMYANLCNVLSSRLGNESDARDFRSSILATCQKAYQNRAGPSSFDDLPEEEKEDAIAKLRRHSKGVVIFIGELFNIRLLPVNVIRNCVVSLFQSGSENDVEDGCTLLMVIGKEFDKGAQLKVLMERLTQVMASMADPKTSSLSSRVRFMLRDCLDLRASGWNPRREKAVATTIAEVHKKAAEDARRKEEKAQQSRGRDRRDRDRDRDRDRGFTSHRSRSRGSNRSGIMNRNSSKSRRPMPARSMNDGWSTVRKPRSADDGVKPSRGSSMLAQQSCDVRLAGLSANRAGLSRTRNVARERSEPQKPEKSLSSANVFHALNDAGGSDSENESDVGETVSDASETGSGAPSSCVSDEPIDEEALRRSVKGLLEEFFYTAEIDEAVRCVEELPSNQLHHEIVLSAMSIATDQGLTSVERSSKLLLCLSSKGHLSGEHFTQGLTEFLEFVPDLAVDIPRIYEFLPMILSDLVLGDCISLSIFGTGAMSLIKEDNSCEKVVMPTLRRICDSKDDSFLLQIVRDSGLASKLPELMPSDDLRAVLQRYDLEALLPCL